MTYVIQAITIGILGLIVYQFSPNGSEWLVWGLYLIIAIILFLQAMHYRERFRAGESLKQKDILGMMFVPPTVTIVVLALIALLFIEISKFHLLWFGIPVSFFFEILYGKKLVSETEKMVLGLNKEPNKK